MNDNLSVTIQLFEEITEFVLVYLVFLKLVPYLRSKSKWYQEKELLIRLGIMIYFFSNLVGDIFVLVSKNQGIQYDLYFLRVTTFYSAHVSTGITIPIMFFSIIILSAFRTKKFDIDNMDSYFASVFTMFYAFLHELIWNTIYLFQVGIGEPYFLAVEEISYIFAVSMLIIIIIKLKVPYLKYDTKFIVLPVFIIGLYFTYWSILGLPITLINIQKSVSYQTQYYYNLFVNQLEVYSWWICFISLLLLFSFMFIYALNKKVLSPIAETTV